MIPSDVGLILIPELIFILDSDENDEEPFINYGVMIEIDGLDDLVIFVLVLGCYFYFVLFLETDFIELFY